MPMSCWLADIKKNQKKSLKFRCFVRFRAQNSKTNTRHPHLRAKLNFPFAIEINVEKSVEVTKVCNIDFGGSGGGQRKLSFARRGVYKMGVSL